MNAPMENRGLNKITKNKVFKIVLIAVFTLSVIANGVQGYFMAKKAKAYRVLEAIVENKSNCPPIIPVKVETPAEPAPTPTAPTTKRKSSTPTTDTTTDASTDVSPSTDTGTSTPEVVIPPPPPPSN